MKHEKAIQILSSGPITPIAKQVCDALQRKDSRFGHSEVQNIIFACGEIKPRIPETVRHKHVFLFHSLQFPDPNTSIVQLLLTIDAISRASAEDITLVLPFLSYLRQDRKDEPRVPISARLVADLLQLNPSVKHILTIDLHSDQAQGFYAIPVDNLYCAVIHAEYFRDLFKGNVRNIVVVSPDHGGVARARRFAKELAEDVPVAIIDKRRTGPNQAEVMHFIGEGIEGKDVILYDDIIDTGGTILAAAALAKQRGARPVFVCATHGLFSRKPGAPAAEELFRAAGITAVVTNTIPRTEQYYLQNIEWLRCVSINELLVRAIYESTLSGGSVSSLLQGQRTLQN